MRVLIVCEWCGCTALKERGAVNRSRKLGAPVYCGMTCAGLARRKHRTVEQKKARKADYDRERRERLGESLLAQKRAAYHANPPREKERERRQKNKHRHLAYIRTPQYRAWKADYDRRHLSAKHYGEFADAALELRDLEKEIGERVTREEIYVARGYYNKRQTRKRDYEKAHRS